MSERDALDAALAPATARDEPDDGEDEDAEEAPREAPNEPSSALTPAPLDAIARYVLAELTASGTCGWPIAVQLPPQQPARRLVVSPEFAHALASTRRLRSLHFNGCGAPRLDDAARLWRALAACSTLCEVSLANTKLTAADLATLLAEFTCDAAPRLDTLDLSHTRLDVAAADVLARAALGSAASKSPLARSIRRLDLSRNSKLGPVGATLLLDAMRVADSQIQSLSLARAGLTDACVPALCAFLERAKRLTKLDLSGNALGDASAPSLARSLIAASLPVSLESTKCGFARASQEYLRLAQKARRDPDRARVLALVGGASTRAQGPADPLAITPLQAFLRASGDNAALVRVLGFLLPRPGTETGRGSLRRGAMPGLLERLPGHAQTLMTSTAEDPRTLEACSEIRKLLSIERRPPIDEVIATGVVPRLVELLRDERSSDELQFEAAWALTNVASGTSAHTRVVADLGAVPEFVRMLSSDSSDNVEQGVWGLGNISGDCIEFRDAAIAAGATEPILRILDRVDIRLSLMRNAVWALSNLVRGTPPPPIEISVETAARFARYAARPDDDARVDSERGLGYIANANVEGHADIVFDAVRAVDGAWAGILARAREHSAKFLVDTVCANGSLDTRRAMIEMGAVDVVVRGGRWQAESTCPALGALARACRGAPESTVARARAAAPDAMRELTRRGVGDENAEAMDALRAWIEVEEIAPLELVRELVVEKAAWARLAAGEARGERARESARAVVEAARARGGEGT